MSQSPALAQTLIRAPHEEARDFNNRLRNACTNEKAPPYTDFTATVVNGVPCITLISRMIPAEEQDVEDSKDSSSPLELGDPIPDGDELIVQVVQLLAATDKQAEESEERATKLAGRYDGTVVRADYAKGMVQRLVDVFDAQGKPTGTKTYVLDEVCYLVLGYAMAEAEDGADDEHGNG